MKRTIEDLLRRLKDKSKNELNPEKIFCEDSDILPYLIADGANIIKKDVKQSGDTYVTEVLYMGCIVQTVSDKPLRIGEIFRFSDS